MAKKKKKNVPPKDEKKPETSLENKEPKKISNAISFFEPLIEESDEIKIKNLLVKYYAHQLITNQSKVPLFALKEKMENESIEDVEIIAYNHYKKILLEISLSEMKNLLEVCYHIENSSADNKTNILLAYCQKMKIQE